jgi:hypothetical protein
MKRQLLLALFLTPLFVLNAIGQEADNIDNSATFTEEVSQTELRINALTLMVGPALDISYEHVLSSASGLGASLLLNFGGDNYGSQKFALSPFYRFYFFDQKDYGARGLFVEGFSSL